MQNLERPHKKGKNIGEHACATFERDRKNVTVKDI